MGGKGSTKNMCNLLRRACSGVVDRDPCTFGRPDYLPPLRPPRPSGIQSDHVTSVARLCARQGTRLRESLAAGANSTTHADQVNEPGADWRNCERSRSVSERSAQRTSSCSRLSM